MYGRLHQSLARAGRLFSSQAELQPRIIGTKLSQIDNALKVVSTNESAKTSNVVLLVNTGSRDENSSNLGASHAMQASAALTNAKNTAFLTTQLIASLGASLEVTSGREHILYKLGCSPNDVKELFVDVLVPSVFSPKFSWWEVEEISKRMRFQKQLAESDPAYLLMEAAHKASFRGGLGNSILSPDNMIGKHTGESLAEYLSTLNSGNMVLGSSGLSHDDLVECGQALNIGGGQSAQRTKSEFVQSEIHVNSDLDIVQAALCFNGVSLSSKDAISLSVLSQVLGGRCNVKRGSGLANGLLNKAVEKATGAAFSTSSTSINYSDSGLFVVHVVSPKESIQDVLKATSNECNKIAGGSVSSSDVAAAKNRLKSIISMNAESSASMAVDAAVQASVLGTFASPDAICSLIDGVTAQNVSAVAKQVLGGKKSLASVGSTPNGLFLQDLC